MAAGWTSSGMLLTSSDLEVFTFAVKPTVSWEPFYQTIDKPRINLQRGVEEYFVKSFMKAKLLSLR